MRVLSLILLASVSLAVAQQRKRYDVYRAASPIKIDAKLDEEAWKRAPSVGPFNFHLNPGDPANQQTTVKLLWDDENLYLGYEMDDAHISAYITERHGPVSKDDCVELFLSPNPDKVTNYYTFEINAIGTMLNRCKTDWWTGPPTWEPEGVRYQTTFQGQAKKDPSPSDRKWALEIAIPLANFAHDAAHTPPHGGDVWRLNLNRLEGLDHPDSKDKRLGLSTWSPLGEGVTSFHSPEWFGEVRFLDATPPK
ncbi:MAG: carbohydrate-binding family 9-like protein [Bryobacterales bacterium]